MQEKTVSYMANRKAIALNIPTERPSQTHQPKQQKSKKI